MIFQITPAMLAIIVIADLFFGDASLPFPHPVVLIGRLVKLLENWLYPPRRQERREIVAGAALVFIVCLLTFVLTWAVIKVTCSIWPVSGFLVAAFLGYTTLAAAGLAQAAADVLIALEQKGIEEARNSLAMIVGRDTAALDREEILKAVVETVAENISDAVVAPLFYLLLGGVPLAMLYKAVNTMDSMLGYRNERYESFGRTAARLDDLANYLPARLSGLLIIAAGWILGYDPGRGWQIMKKYHHVHQSPNSGYPEAAMAGILGIELGGPSNYFGRTVARGVIGESRVPLCGYQVREAIKVLYLCTFLISFLGALIIW